MMDTAQKTECGTAICKYYERKMGVKVLLLPLAIFSASQKPGLFGRNLSGIYEHSNCMSSSDSVVLIASLVKYDDEFLQKTNNFQSVGKFVKWKSMIRKMKDDDRESSVYQVQKIILLILCLFKISKNFSICDKAEYRKTETITFENSIWKTIISETIYQILISPGSDENLKTLCRSLLKMNNDRMDSLMPPENSFQKLHTKGSNPKEIEKGCLADSANFILVLLGWSGDYPTGTMEVFDATTQKWLFFRHDMNSFRAYHGVALFGSKLYIIGGYNGYTVLSTTICLNMKSRQRSEKSSMSMPRCYVFTLTFRGCIYAFGGHSGGNRLKSCERFDPNRNRWARISDMMFRRSDASGAELNGRIFVCGGFDGFQFHYTTEMYDPEFDEWTLIGNLINPRSGHSMVNYDGQLFVLGGYNGTARLQEVEKYNEETNQWEEYIPMLIGRSNFCCVVFEQAIYVIGGYNGNATINNVEVFNNRVMNWQRGPSLNVDRSAAAACVMNTSTNITACDPKEFVPVVSTDIEETSP